MLILCTIIEVIDCQKYLERMVRSQNVERIAIAQ